MGAFYSILVGRAKLEVDAGELARLQEPWERIQVDGKELLL
jgi:hypothetical protein